MPENIRYAKYHRLLEMGYTPSQARQRRDWSNKRLQKSIAGIIGNLTKKETKQAITPEESDRLLKLRSTTKKYVPPTEGPTEPPRKRKVEVLPSIKSRADRVADWSRWSSNKLGFPDNIQALIDEINKQHGYPAFASFGYRAYYHFYVNQIEESEALRLAEQDT